MSGIEDSRISTNPEQGLVDPQSGASGNSGAVADRHQPILSHHNDLPTRQGVSSLQRRNSPTGPDGSIRQESSAWMSPPAMHASQANSSSPYDEGLHSNPPSVIDSNSGRSIPSIDLNRHIDNPGDRSNNTPESFADVRVGRAPTIDHAAIANSLQGEQLIAVQQIIAHHTSQRRRLLTAGQLLRDVRSEAQDLRIHAEGLGGRVERVLSDTVRTIIDGDHSLAALGNAFSGDGNGVGGGAESTAPMDHMDPVVTESHDDGNRVDEGLVSSRDTPADNMDREFERRRPDETPEQFNSRYERHMRTINTTHNAWVRDLTRDRDTRGMDESIPPTRHNEAQFPVRESRNLVDHIDRPVYNSGPEGSAPQGRVQFDSASRAPRARDRHAPLGVSQYRITGGPTESGLWNAEHYHQDVMLAKVRRNVEWKVGNPITAPMGAKHPKISEPNKYSGNRSHDNFCNWLDQFLNWLRAHYISGIESDGTRINLLGNYLDGAALDWYAAEIDNPDMRAGSPILFIDAICALHTRFVHTATACDAKTRYDSVLYSTTESTEGFYYKLDKFASRMVQRPDDYSFKIRFFEGLPDWIYNQLTTRGITPEYSTIDDLRTNARQIEEMKSRIRGSLTGLNDYTQSGRKRDSPRDSNRQGSNPRTSRSDQYDRKSKPTTSTKPSGNRESKTRFTPRAPHDPKAAGHSHSHQHDSSKSTPRSTNELTCFKCGGTGHIASNPKCPQYAKPSRPRVNAQRLLDEDEGHEGVTCQDHPQEVESVYSNSWGGSQYEAESEPDAQSEDDEGAETAPEGEEDSADEDTVHMSSMRIRMNAMRVHYMDDIINLEELPQRVRDHYSTTDPLIPIEDQQDAADEDELPDLIPIEDESVIHANECASQDHHDWTCEECGNHTPRIAKDMTGTECRYQAICTSCKAIHSYDAEPQTAVRVNAMYTDEFDDYFGESYENDYWNEANEDDLDIELQAQIEEECRLRKEEDDTLDQRHALDLDNVVPSGHPHATEDAPTTQELTSILPGWMPYDVLQALPDEVRIELYSTRRREENPDWAPKVPMIEFALNSSVNSSTGVTPFELTHGYKPPLDDNARNHFPAELIALGYTVHEELDDCHWLERLAEQRPEQFQLLTGYRVPPRVKCEECNNCNPRLWETVHVIMNGPEYYSFQMVCEQTIWSGNAPPKVVVDQVEETTTRINDIADELSRVSMSASAHDAEQDATLAIACAIPLPLDNEEPEPLAPTDTRTNEDSYEEGSESETDSGCHCCRAYGHPRRTCDDCGHDNTRVVERMSYDGGDVVIRYYLECDDCDTVAPLDTEYRREERMNASRVIHSSNIHRKTPAGQTQPIRSSELQAILAAEVEVNGVKAFTLFDSGSTTDSITPEFAFATKAKQITLEDQVILQLGCVGSRSKICYGTRIPVNVCGIQEEVYFDLVNLDRYDCIIGTPFMNTHGVCLDFKNRTITINGVACPAMTRDEESLFLRNKKETVHSKRQSRLPPRETQPIAGRNEASTSRRKDT